MHKMSLIALSMISKNIRKIWLTKDREWIDKNVPKRWIVTNIIGIKQLEIWKKITFEIEKQSTKSFIYHVDRKYTFRQRLS